MKMPLIATLALGTALIVAAPASAQTSSTASSSQTTTQQQMPPGPGYGRMGRGMGPGMMGRRGMRHGGCHGMRGMGMGMGRGMGMMRYPDGTLAFLKAELKIKASQSKQWDAFVHALRSSADAMQKMRAEHWKTRRPQTLKAWLDRREQRAAMRLETMRHMTKALLPLYDSLDASQKQTADGLFMPCGRQSMGRGMGWWSNTPADNDDSDD